MSTDEQKDEQKVWFEVNFMPKRVELWNVRDGVLVHVEYEKSNRISVSKADIGVNLMLKVYYGYGSYDYITSYVFQRKEMEYDYRFTKQPTIKQDGSISFDLGFNPTKVQLRKIVGNTNYGRGVEICEDDLFGTAFDKNTEYILEAYYVKKRISSGSTLWHSPLYQEDFVENGSLILLLIGHHF